MTEKNISILWYPFSYKIFWEKNTRPFLILHGWWGESASWQDVGQLLEKSGFQVFVPDLPWFWKTELTRIFTLEDYAEVIECFVEKLWLTDIILLWHSNGGAISIRLKRRNHIKISKLILNNAAGIRNKRKTNLKRKILKFGTFPFKIFKKFPSYEKSRNIFYRIIWSQDYINAGKNPYLKATYQNMIQSDLQADIKKLSGDILLIRWRQDTYTPLCDGKLMNSLISNSKLVVLDWVRHGIHLQNPNLLAKAIVENIA